MTWEKPTGQQTREMRKWIAGQAQDQNIDIEAATNAAKTLGEHPVICTMMLRVLDHIHHLESRIGVLEVRVACR